MLDNSNGNSNLLRINMHERYTKRSNNDPFKIYLEASTDCGYTWTVVCTSVVNPANFDLDTLEVVKSVCTFEPFFDTLETFLNLGFELVCFVR